MCAVLFTATPSRAQSVERFERRVEQLRREQVSVSTERGDATQRALIDYGAYLTLNYYSIDDAFGQNHVLREYGLVPYFRLNLDGVHEVFLRGRATYQDFHAGDAFDGGDDNDWDDTELERGFYRLDLARYQSAYRGRETDWGLSLQAGRDLIYVGNGLVLSEVVDGAVIRGQTEALDVQLFAGVTAPQTIDFDTSRPDFDDDTRRGVYGAVVSTALGRHRPFLYAISQRDYNSEDELLIFNINTQYHYDSYYIGGGSTGSLSDSLLYRIEAVYQGGDNLSNSFEIANGSLQQIVQTEERIEAWAVDLQLDYLLRDRGRTRFSLELLAASGDDDRGHTSNTFNGNRSGTTDRAFNGVGLINTGLAFSPPASNLLMARVGVATFPFPEAGPLDRLQVGCDVFAFGKADPDAPFDELTDPGERYLGWEPSLFLNWSITSDLTLAIRYGVFFPSDAIVTDDDPRHFFFTGLTYAF